MICTRCGRSVPDGARFCPNCGAAVTVVTPPGTESAPTSGPMPATAPGIELDQPLAPPATPTPEPMPGYNAPAVATGFESAPPPAPHWSGAAAPAPHWSGAALPPASATPDTGAAPGTALVYGGFWRRLLALVLDGILLNILMSPLYLAWVWPRLTASMSAHPEDMAPAEAFSIFGAMMGFVLAATVVEILYFAILESTTLQASVGKLAMGLRLADLEGRPISFGRALLRRLARILSGFTLFIGYLMMLWTRRRQTLHDLMTRTLVLRR